MKKFVNFIYWAIIVSLMTWTIASFVNTNMSNVGEAEIAAWNVFELASQFEEAVNQ